MLNFAEDIFQYFQEGQQIQTKKPNIITFIDSLLISTTDYT